jgi:Xaa-Pro aminopeptidase
MRVVRRACTQEDAFAVDVHVAHGDAVESNIATQHERSKRCELFAGCPRPCSSDDDARPVRHHHGVEGTFAPGRAQLIMKRNERVRAAPCAAFLVDDHGRIVATRVRVANFRGFWLDGKPRDQHKERMHACFRDLYARRRAHVLAAMAASGEPAVAVLPAAPTYVRNNDVDHEYRQDSDLFYLTGFDEPQSVLVLSTPARPEEKACVMFVRPRDPEREVWDGPRAGVDGAKAEYGADESFTIDKLESELPKLLTNRRRLYFRLGRDRSFDDRVLEALEATRRRARLGIFWPTEISDPGLILHEMRLVKGTEDLDAMRTAARITRDAHLRAMAHTRAGMHEYEVEALLLETFRKNGSERPAYGSIVGSGANATVLHYRANNRKMEDGDLLLIDAGCEYGYYASDVTRTFPVSGKFTTEQRAIYQIVLDAQLASIEATRVGATLDEVHKKSVEVVTNGLRELGILQGETRELIEKEAYKPYFMHRTSHWLGMDVHDVGSYYVGGKPRVLGEGMVLTVEPGIYIPQKDEKVDSKWRGIGVRIEDDILVTSDGHQNLTADIPKAIADLEAACA